MTYRRSRSVPPVRNGRPRGLNPRVPSHSRSTRRDRPPSRPQPDHPHHRPFMPSLSPTGVWPRRCRSGYPPGRSGSPDRRGHEARRDRSLVIAEVLVEQTRVQRAIVLGRIRSRAAAERRDPLVADAIAGRRRGRRMKERSRGLRQPKAGPSPAAPRGFRFAGKEQYGVTGGPNPTALCVTARWRGYGLAANAQRAAGLCVLWPAD